MEYLRPPKSQVPGAALPIASFMDEAQENFDAATVESFGEEWEKFGKFTDEEIDNAGRQYFDIVTPAMLHNKATVLDLGCGTGRWTKYIAPRAGFVEALDPSKAVYSAAELLKGLPNVRITQAGVDNIPFPDHSFDFAFSLGVLHHIPDTAAALEKVVKKVKPGGYCLIYLYYSLDNRGPLHKTLFFLSNILRQGISKMPSGIKSFVCDVLAVLVYMPFVLLSRLLRLFGGNFFRKVPLSYYHDKSFHIIRNDALDRFGTPLEQRFSRVQIKAMMEKAGLGEVVFSENEPYWHAVGKKL